MRSHRSKARQQGKTSGWDILFGVIVLAAALAFLMFLVASGTTASGDEIKSLAVLAQQVDGGKQKLDTMLHEHPIPSEWQVETLRNDFKVAIKRQDALAASREITKDSTLGAQSQVPAPRQ